MKVIRTTNADPRYRSLVRELDRFLAVTDGEDHGFYDQFNGSDDIPYVLVAEAEGEAVACGALKPYDPTTLEVKRMYTAEAYRGRGIAVRLLQELEAWARELGYRRLVLETGKRQVAAIRLYEKYGFSRMAENYGPYRTMDNSVCMERML
ncbi:acetyltransferase (GNAT) family protein [Neolewinella xylanilytica]|uniref:Acetyltransferase (GNAT) family protein n=1 Tax=Neolewinella xylanilytica TaxID=1514080 RepID=A0A2S6I6Q3_9BACT|nr:GNAT family N-acetyltransferase [Neolewinella xylanilytica]PPK87149.1 acetyltransferase (GNAT) family protein [Neolewinella xylanilytica]